MNVLFDMNVLLDVLLKRQSWVQDSDAVWQAHADGRIQGYISLSILPTLFYLVRRNTDLVTAYYAVRICASTFGICPVDQQALTLALRLPGSDFEDNLQAMAARLAGLDNVVTRDPKDFKGSGLQVFTPTDLLTQLP